MKKLVFAMLLLGTAVSAAEPHTKLVFGNEVALPKNAPPLFAPAASNRQPLLALVRIRAVEVPKDAPSPCGSDPGTVCMSNWFRYELDIKQVLVGDERRKTVSALRVGHALSGAPAEGEYSPDVLAILAPDDPDEQTRPRADYRLKRLVWPSYCFSDALSAYGLKSSKGDGAGCHSADTIRRASDRDDEDSPS